MKVFSCLLTLVCCVSQFAFGQDDVQIIKRAEVGVIKQSILEDSSEFNRMQKKYVLTAQLLGVGPNPTSGSGINFGFHLNRNSLLILEATTSYEKYGIFSDREIKGSSIGVHYKQFTANSFYFNVGIDQRKIDYSYGDRGIFFTSLTDRYSFHGNSTDVSFSIGNQWQWQNFTLGCDWIGVIIPVASKTSEKLDPAYKYDFTKADLEREKNRYVYDTTAAGLRFYLGATF